MKKLLLMLSMIMASNALYPGAGKIAAFLGAASGKIGLKAANLRQKYGSLVGPSLVGGGLFAVGEVYGKEALSPENPWEKPLQNLKGEMQAQQVDMMRAIQAGNAVLAGISGALGASLGASSEPTTWYGSLWRNSRMLFEYSKIVLGDVAHAAQLLAMVGAISKTAYAYAHSSTQDDNNIPEAQAASAPEKPVAQPQVNSKQARRQPVMRRR